MARYTFIDRAIDLRLPADWAAQWDLLYGAFRSEAANAPALTVCCHEPREGRTELEIDGRSRSIPRENVLLYLQDLVQNQMLPAVRSRLLWHGAAWMVDGQGIMILGESGVGKTTLSVAEQLSGGRVLSDEIAVWNPGHSLLETFPRSMAVRSDTLTLLGERERYARLTIDEEKWIIPLPGDEPAVPLRAVVILEWAKDERVSADETIYELDVLAPDLRWQEELSRIADEVRFDIHPDGGGWWRCRSREPIPVPALESGVRAGGGFVRGFHRGARRVPNYNKAPQLSPLTTTAASERALGELLNARMALEVWGGAPLMGLIRAACDKACCVACVPGRVDATRDAIRTL